ncbi:MAG: hypothetical protein AAF089_02705 [Bacteroidota bacterium]
MTHEQRIFIRIVTVAWLQRSGHYLEGYRPFNESLIDENRASKDIRELAHPTPISELGRDYLALHGDYVPQLISHAEKYLGKNADYFEGIREKRRKRRFEILAELGQRLSLWADKAPIDSWGSFRPDLVATLYPKREAAVLAGAAFRGLHNTSQISSDVPPDPEDLPPLPIPRLDVNDLATLHSMLREAGSERAHLDALDSIDKYLADHDVLDRVPQIRVQEISVAADFVMEHHSHRPRAKRVRIALAMFTFVGYGEGDERRVKKALDSAFYRREQKLGVDREGCSQSSVDNEK